MEHLRKVEQFVEAAKQGNITKLEKLLEAQEQPNEISTTMNLHDPRKVSILIIVSCKKCNLAKLRTISLQRGQGRTALHFACQSGHLDIVKLLIISGADINARSWEVSWY